MGERLRRGFPSVGSDEPFQPRGSLSCGPVEVLVFVKVRNQSLNNSSVRSEGQVVAQTAGSFRGSSVSSIKSFVDWPDSATWSDVCENILAQKG